MLYENVLDGMELRLNVITVLVCPLVVAYVKLLGMALIKTVHVRTQAHIDVGVQLLILQIKALFVTRTTVHHKRKMEFSKGVR